VPIDARAVVVDAPGAEATVEDVHVVYPAPGEVVAQPLASLIW